MPYAMLIFGASDQAADLKQTAVSAIGGGALCCDPTVHRGAFAVQESGALGAPVPLGGVLLACTLATVLAMALSCILLGVSRRVFFEDLVMVALTEAATSLVLAMPLAWPRWIAAHHDALSVIAGTALALVGIVLNHLALRTDERPTQVRDTR